MKGNFKKLINSEVPVLIDFYADWCGPCKIQAPILKEVSKIMGEKAKIIKVDVDKNPEVANRFQIKSIPTLMMFKKGETIWRKSGVADKNELLSVLKTNS